MPYLVLKPIPTGNGQKLQPGTVVDAENWRQRRTLEAGRYIQRIEPDSKADATAPAKKVAKVGEPAVKPVVEPIVAEESPKKRVGRPAKADDKKV